MAPIASTRASVLLPTPPFWLTKATVVGALPMPSPAPDPGLVAKPGRLSLFFGHANRPGRVGKGQSTEALTRRAAAAACYVGQPRYRAGKHGVWKYGLRSRHRALAPAKCRFDLCGRGLSARPAPAGGAPGAWLRSRSSSRSARSAAVFAEAFNGALWPDLDGAPTSGAGPPKVG